MRETIALRCLISILLLSCSTGCGRISPWHDAEPALSPLEVMNEAMRQGRWDEAWQLSDAVAKEHAADRRVLTKLARVAFESQHPSESADFLIAACRAESFADEDRVQQAVVAAVFVGRLFDALAFLAAAVADQPEQLQTRRLIFDLLMGIENRTPAQPHGQYLVLKRRFDVELLTSLCNTGRNLPESDSLDKVLARNPSDKRPLIPQAMGALDKGLFTDAIVQLEQILDAHPECVQAQVLLGEALVAAGNFDALKVWHDRLQGAYENEVSYWKTIGDWASHDQDHAAAARAYWEATKRDSYMLDAWVGLRAELSQVNVAEMALPPTTLTAIEHCIEQLRRLKQARYRFVKSRSISRVTALEIAEILEDLGRLWEAEAWLAIASTLPEDPTADIVTARQEVVAKLSQDTPWQVRQGHPELELDLSHLPLPAMFLAK